MSPFCAESRRDKPPSGAAQPMTTREDSEKIKSFRTAAVSAVWRPTSPGNGLAKVKTPDSKPWRTSGRKRLGIPRANAITTGEPPESNISSASRSSDE